MTPNTQNDTAQSLFHQYMMATLQRSSDYADRLMTRSYNAIQLFLTLLTGLLGALILVLTTVTEPSLRSSITALIFTLAAGFSALTYMWLLVTINQQRHEEVLRYFLEKYFRDLAPQVYDSYGLSHILNPFTRIHNSFQRNPNTVRSLAQNVGLLSIIILAPFSGFLLTVAVYHGWWLVTGTTSMLLAAVIGILSVVGLLLISWIVNRQFMRHYAVTQDIFNTYHTEQPAADPAQG